MQAMQAVSVNPRLKEKYQKEIIPLFLKDHGFSNKMAVPRLVKIVVNMSSGRAIEDSKFLEKAQGIIANITGQLPVIVRAKKSVSSFKLREGMPIAVKVTLRGAKMYEFLDRLISVALPRVRDFRGTKNKFDGHGNFTLGVSEMTVFPEASLEDDNFGFEISINTTAKDDKNGELLLRSFGFPLKNKEKK